MTLSILGACGEAIESKVDYVVVTDVVGVPGALPATSDARAVMNPARPGIEIRFGLPRAGLAEIRIFDVRGQLTTVLGGHAMGAAAQVVRWNGTDRMGAHANPGVYFYRLTLDGRNLGSVGKLTLLR